MDDACKSYSQNKTAGKENQIKSLSVTVHAKNSHRVGEQEILMVVRAWHSKNNKIWFTWFGVKNEFSTHFQSHDIYVSKLI